ncbi:hypothetical protein PsorP6_014044 [Peronosclerospora sorghi]|uniref:Uncharacterized protein n=1 Tax=Peronosclerospora sorghi TaxID=230839 RepID=A0ACC0VHE4_9STRA|nr:hypothetical protein PsorP6_014044 [Peronosclerospora sorghi]
MPRGGGSRISTSHFWGISAASHLWGTVRTLRLTDAVEEGCKFPENIIRIGNGEESPVREMDATVTFGAASASAGVEYGLPVFAFAFRGPGLNECPSHPDDQEHPCDPLNDTITALLPGDEYTVPGMPPHRLTLKIGGPAILSRNFDPRTGLGN